jgi:phosphate starvation-inducible PhoH-like protein
MMVRLLKEKHELTNQTVKDLIKGANPFAYRLSNGSSNATILHGRGGKEIKAKTVNQKRLIKASEKPTIGICDRTCGYG